MEQPRKAIRIADLDAAHALHNLQLFLLLG